ncbi:MAG: hypothetical protein ACKV0T_12665 [Planctomycetales bacterium]
MSEPILRIHNNHTPQCGDPPVISGDDPSVYIGYFENPFGEQWIFTYNHETRKAELRGGDVGWDTVLSVVNGTVEGIIFGKAELLWLLACWKAATGT